MAARDKVTSLKLKNIAGVIYDNDWIKWLEYEGEDNNEIENEDFFEEDQEDKDYTDREIMKVETNMKT